MILYVLRTMLAQTHSRTVFTPGDSGTRAENDLVLKKRHYTNAIEQKAAVTAIHLTHGEYSRVQFWHFILDDLGTAVRRATLQMRLSPFFGTRAFDAGSVDHECRVIVMYSYATLQGFWFHEKGEKSRSTGPDAAVDSKIARIHSNIGFNYLSGVTD